MKTTDFIKTKKLLTESSGSAEYNDEASTSKNSLHTIIRVATHLERAIGDNENLPEWCQEKIAEVKALMVNVMDYIISQHEMGKQDQMPGFDAQLAESQFKKQLYKPVTEDATGGAASSASFATTVETLGQKGDFTKKDVNKKLKSYTNVISRSMKLKEGSENLKSAVLQCFNNISHGAQSGNDMIDYLADELNDYYKAVRASGDSQLKKAYAYMVSNGQEAEGNPKLMAQVAQQAISMLSQNDVVEGVAETLPIDDAVKVLRHYGAEGFKTTSNELHFYKNGKPLSVDLIMNSDATRSVNLSQLNSVTRKLKGQGVAEATGNIGAEITSLYRKIYKLGDDAVDHVYHTYPTFKKCWDKYEGDLQSIVAEVSPAVLQKLHAELLAAAQEEGVA